LSVNDVRREISFCHKVGLPIMGIIENMSGYTCPHCKDCTYVFNKRGGQLLADNTKCKLLGSLPIDPQFIKCIEENGNFLDKLKDSESFIKMKQIVDKIIEEK
jgi:hypothetical protein